MKNLIVCIMISTLFGLSMNAQDMAENSNSPVLSKGIWANVQWDKKVCNLGDVIHKVPVTAVFTLKNTGGKPILINRVKGSCGCTKIDYSHKPLLPGKSTKIEATYNAANLGNFTKTVRVFLNDEKAVHTLTLKGVVVKK